MNAPKFKIAPSQNARHSVKMRLKPYKLGMFGGNGTKNKDNDTQHDPEKYNDEDLVRDRHLSRYSSSLEQRHISLSDSGEASSPEDTVAQASDSEKRPVSRAETLKSAAKARKRREVEGTRAPSMKTAYVDLSGEVAPGLESSASLVTLGKNGTVSGRSYSKLKKHLYVLDESGGQMTAPEKDDSHVEKAASQGKDSERFWFVNWKAERMWLAVGTGVVVIDGA